jgi:diacylglycerol kinase family enzyme
MTRHLFVVNPITRSASSTAEQVKAICGRLGVEPVFRFTERPKHAADIVKEEARSGTDLRVYVLGGDGTLHEAVNGAAGYGNISLTHIPCGTGNDFIRCFGGKDVFLRLEELITSDREVLLDLMEIAVDGAAPIHAINICSVGVDADVAAGVKRYKWAKRLGGSKMPYNLALALTVIKGVKRPYTVVTDGERFEQKFTIMTCCNGQVYGGGFKACPDADPADGRLELFLVKGIGRVKLTQIVKKYADGRYKELPQYIRHLPGTSMSIEAARPFFTNCDGEVYLAKKVVFSLSPHKLHFILP